METEHAASVLLIKILIPSVIKLTDGCLWEEEQPFSVLAEEIAASIGRHRPALQNYTVAYLRCLLEDAGKYFRAAISIGRNWSCSCSIAVDIGRYHGTPCRLIQILQLCELSALRRNHGTFFGRNRIFAESQINIRTKTQLAETV